MKRLPAGEGCSIYKEVQMIYTFPPPITIILNALRPAVRTPAARDGGIMIDSTLKKYRDMEGPFGSRLHNSISLEGRFL